MAERRVPEEVLTALGDEPEREALLLHLIRADRVSVAWAGWRQSRAADVLGVSVHRVHELAREQRIEIGATGEDYRRSTETARDLL